MACESYRGTVIEQQGSLWNKGKALCWRGVFLYVRNACPERRCDRGGCHSEKSRGSSTPLQGLALTGKVKQTVLRGTVVYDDARDLVVAPGTGQFVPRQSVQRLARWLQH